MGRDHNLGSNFTREYMYIEEKSLLKSSSQNQLPIKPVTSVEAPLSSVNSGSKHDPFG